MRTLWRHSSFGMLLTALAQTSLVWSMCFVFTRKPNESLFIMTTCMRFVLPLHSSDTMNDFLSMNSATSGVNRHAGRLSVLVSLFSGLVLGAQLPRNHAAIVFIYCFVYCLVHAESHIMMNTLKYGHYDSYMKWFVFLFIITLHHYSCCFLFSLKWVLNSIRKIVHQQFLAKSWAERVEAALFSLLPAAVFIQNSTFSVILQFVCMLYIFIHFHTRLIPSLQ